MRLSLFLFAPALLHAQLTMDQKVADFQYLAGLFAKQYGPYEWKRDVIHFDLLDTAPWLPKITASKNDLEFYDVLLEYVNKLDDAHVGYSIPSNFAARLNFTVDLYDGILLVDSINRTRLPASEFPFLFGYELVSIDGVPAMRILDGFVRYSASANLRSTRRSAAELVTSRFQSILPNAPDVPEISTVVFRRPDGALATFRIPWSRTGLPVTTIGKYPVAPFADSGEAPSYLEPLLQLQNLRIPDRAVLNVGVRNPLFASALPNFTLRQGRLATDTFFSGVTEWQGYKMGFIRIPNFTPANTTTALNAFLTEIAFFQANTDGLVVDITRNTGGSASYASQLLAFLIPYQWTSIGFEVRATSTWVASISSSLEAAKAQNAPAEIIAQFQAIKDAIVSANAEMRGRTTPIPLDGTTLDHQPLRAQNGSLLAYTKPLILLTDEFTASGGDFFAAIIQDSARGPLFGYRTMGAGGNVVSTTAGSYSLGAVSVTQSLMVRSRDVSTPDYPTTRYLENVGVRPDIEYDPMNRENLMSGGLEFVGTFLNALIEHIQTSK